MGGINYVRAKDILGVLFTEREKCNILMIGGVTVPATSLRLLWWRASRNR